MEIRTAELERRMRPGAWSDGGFLGQTESLSDVLAKDAATLAELGVGYDELADSLSLLIEAPKAGLPRFPNWREETQLIRDNVIRRFGSLEHADFYTARVGGRYEISRIIYLGMQTCPWSKPDSWPKLNPSSNPDEAVSRPCGSASTDWRIRNAARDLELSGPTLIVHLIREHNFFEGFESPYRVDPRALAELLELGPFAD